MAGSGSGIPANPEGEPGLRKGPGILFLVATPIGNLEDVTLRALRVFREVDWIAAEDTRRTRILLERHGIECPLISHHAHTEHQRGPRLVARLLKGERGALVTDAGTPGISDPGFLLARMAREAGIAVETIPGPSAVMAALAASGLPTDAFRFGGFLPPRSSARRKALTAVKNEPATLIFFEAPHRIRETLADIQEVLGARPVVLAREITKLHEQFLRGTAAELSTAEFPLKGEFTLLVGKAPEEPRVDDEPVADAVAARIRAGTSRMDAIKAVARERGLSKREVYRLVLGQE